MRMAITDRTGEDTSPLELHVEQTKWDSPPLPRLGTLVCAIGQDHWRYIGEVISTDEGRHSYTVAVWTASNKLMDNIKQYGGAP